MTYPTSNIDDIHLMLLKRRWESASIKYVACLGNRKSTDAQLERAERREQEALIAYRKARSAIDQEPRS